MIQAPYCAAVDFRFSCNEGNQVSWKQSYYQIVSKRIRFNFGPVIFLNSITMHFLLFYRDKFPADDPQKVKMTRILEELINLTVKEKGVSSVTVLEMLYLRKVSFTSSVHESVQ